MQDEVHRRRVSCPHPILCCSGRMSPDSVVRLLQVWGNGGQLLPYVSLSLFILESKPLCTMWGYCWKGESHKYILSPIFVPPFIGQSCGKEPEIWGLKIESTAVSYTATLLWGKVATFGTSIFEKRWGRGGMVEVYKIIFFRLFIVFFFPKNSYQIQSCLMHKMQWKGWALLVRQINRIKNAFLFSFIFWVPV